MKLLLLVSLPLLASTNVTLAKSTLNGGRQNVTDSQDMSPRTIRNLKQDTTAGTRHQAENAEERFNPEGFALKLAEEAPAVVGKSRSFEGKHVAPRTLFLNLDFRKKDGLFRSQAFREWMQAVEKSNGGNPDRTIIESLLQKISEAELYTMLKREKGKALSDEEYSRLFGSLVSHWLERTSDPFSMWLKNMPRIELEPGTPAALFRKLNSEDNGLFRSKAFKEWMLAVEKSDKGDVDKTIGKILFHYIPRKKMATMLEKAKGGALSDEEYSRLSGYLLSRWLNENKTPRQPVF